MRILIGLIVTMVAAAPTSLAAQDHQTSPWNYTVEVFGNVANGRLSLGDSLWGRGPAWGVGAGFRPFSGWLDRLGFEIQAIQLEDSESPNSQVSHRLDATLLAATILYHFRGHARIQPYLFGGLGHVTTDYTYSCLDCVFDRDPITGALVSRGRQTSRETGSKTGFAYGAGLKVAVRRHLSIRPELLLTDTTPGSGYNWAWVQVQLGLAVHF